MLHIYCGVKSQFSIRMRQYRWLTSQRRRRYESLLMAVMASMIFLALATCLGLPVLDLRTNLRMFFSILKGSFRNLLYIFSRQISFSSSWMSSTYSKPAKFVTDYLAAFLSAYCPSSLLKLCFLFFGLPCFAFNCSWMNFSSMAPSFVASSAPLRMAGPTDSALLLAVVFFLFFCQRTLCFKSAFYCFISALVGFSAALLFF